MQTIEFEANINDGFIKIPQKMKSLKGKHVKIIVLYDEEECSQKTKLPQIFYTPKIKPQYEPFIREDIYSE
jgi:hypothetical protein